MKLIPSSITSKFGRQILQMQKSSPQILFAAGIVGVVGGAILACRATLKLDDELGDIEAKVDQQKFEAEDKDLEVSKKNIAKIYAVGAFDVAKLYSPAIVVGGLGLVALTTSHVTLNRRYAGVTAAYSAAQTMFDQYATRVRAELGEDKERDIREGVIRTIEVDDKNKKVEVVVNDPAHRSAHSRFFDEFSSEWQRNPEYNKMYVQTQEKFLNDMLTARGHVFLNEVYDCLGLSRTPAGQMLGWVRGEGYQNHIDFGLYAFRNKDFMRGVEQSALLDFNVDGVVYDLI